MNKSSKHVGLDVHKNSTAIAVASPGQTTRLAGTVGPQLDELIKAPDHVGPAVAPTMPPAVSLLMKAASVTMAALAAASQSAAAVAQELPDPLAAGWDGKPVCEKLHEDASLRLLRCSFPPGVGHERHFHAPHVGYVIDGGQMRITDASGTRVVDVPSGSVFSNPAGVAWHEVLNVGDTTSTYLIYEDKQPPIAVTPPAPEPTAAATVPDRE